VGEITNRFCGRLQRALQEPMPDGKWRLLVTGHEAAIAHLEQLLGVTRTAPGAGDDCSAILTIPRKLSADEREAFGLAAEVLVFRPIEGLDATIALDWYFDVIEPGNEGEEKKWRHTRAGRLHSEAKYWRWTSPFEGGRRDFELAKMMADAIRRHPLYRAATVLVPVPGHDSAVRGHSDSLAVKLSAETGLPIVRPKAQTAVRPPAKEGSDYDLTDEFTVAHSSIRDATVITVDDAITSGGSLRAVALACRRGGARVVLGLAAVKTMRNSVRKIERR
jgi:hypothetical protein